MSHRGCSHISNVGIWDMGHETCKEAHDVSDVALYMCIIHSFEPLDSCGSENTFACILTVDAWLMLDAYL
jgi:hypothetical protein